MVGFKLSSAIAAVSLLASSVVADVDPIVIKGSKFFYKTNGTEFFIKGLAYQQDAGGNGSSSANVNYVDPLTDVAGCQRDIPNLVDLHTNTIRVYAIDPTGDHTQCMQMLANAGIYVLADLSAPNISISQDAPEWTSELYARYTSVIDALAGYSNTLGFFAGNEVTNNIDNTNAMPFVKAAVRDMKAYIIEKNYRPIGVGYASDDDQTIRAPLEDYLDCGSVEDVIDFFGYNIYSFCGESDFVTSGYQNRTIDFKNYTVPAFFAEYGCITPPRLFKDTASLYSSNMTGVWSGGLVFEYFNAVNDYGLVTLVNNAVTKLPAYTAYSSQIAIVTPSGVNAASYTPTNTIERICPTAQPSWSAATNLPPIPNEDLCGCMMKNLTCVAKSGLSDTVIATLFNITCDASQGLPCSGISANGNTGVYGAFSMCQPQEQLSWAMNAYFLEQAATNVANTDACDFAGNATTQSPSATGSCVALLNQAGSDGTGTVTATPSVGANSGAGSGSGSGSSSSGAASSSGVAGIITIPKFDFGLLTLGVYVTVAALVGAGMVVL